MRMLRDHSKRWHQPFAAPQEPVLSTRPNSRRFQFEDDVYFLTVCRYVERNPDPRGPRRSMQKTGPVESIYGSQKLEHGDPGRVANSATECVVGAG